eukprot:TRINITY_DN58138_c0_g1_i1.p1 TRINITY_DN58138_c0_g1~~TRINITY_DN58138_c0_g1_i1.p1  ORF type:complete len:373 (+),score=43.22 TRINITY_DN58138_c0_g1_i1:43-1161(+)
MTISRSFVLLLSMSWRSLNVVCGKPVSGQATCAAGDAACKPRTFNQPRGGNAMPRAGGPATFMRLPTFDLAEFSEAVAASAALAEAGIDVCFLGIPMDAGTSFRPGTRFGPRQIRQESAMIRPFSMATRAAPFESLQVSDCGDVPINTFHVEKSVDIISDWYSERVLSAGVIPMTMGGDHTIALPLLRALAKKHGHNKIGLVHVDAHSDINDVMFGETIAHGTPFRRAVEEDLLDTRRVVQIGLRGTGYTAEDFDWSRDQGFRVVQAEECWHKSLVPLMEEVRQLMGDGPVYVSFDIDSLDPAFAPGTGTSEVGGLTTIQALEIVRGLHGLNVVGADLVEVSPAYDQAGTTARIAAELLFEMLCMLPGVIRK